MKYTHIVLLSLILSILVNKCHSMLRLYDDINNEIASFYNVDLPNTSYIEVTGNLFVASFNNKDNPCKISEVPKNFNVLVIPFLQAFKLGCKSYANILVSNSWVETIPLQNLTNPKDVNDKSNDNKNPNTYEITTTNSKLIPRTPVIESQVKETLPTKLLRRIETKINEIRTKVKRHIQKISKRIEEKVKELINQKRELTSHAPKVIIFPSCHNGIPGIKEQYNGNMNIIRAATPILTLINIEDTERLIEIANKITHVKVTTEQGPWIGLLYSKPWKAFSVVTGLLYLFIVMVTLFLTPRTYVNLGCALSNPKFWIYPGLGIISAFSFIILEIDPGDIYQNQISIFARQLLCDLKDLLISALYIILHVSWKIVTKKICRERRYHPTFNSEFHTFFKIIQVITALIFTICFALRVTYRNKSNLTPENLMNLLEIVYIIESVALGLIGIGLLVFGIFIILSPRRQRRRSLNRINSINQQLKIILMTSFMIISIILYIGSRVFTILVLTVENFKIEQILNNVMTVFYCLTIIFVLEDKHIGRYLPSNRDNTVPAIPLTSMAPQPPPPPIVTPQPSPSNVITINPTGPPQSPQSPSPSNVTTLNPTGPPQPPPSSDVTTLKPQSDVTDIEDSDKIEVNRSESEVNTNV